MITAREAAALLGVSVDTLKARRRDGWLMLNTHWFRLPGTRAVRYDREALLAWREGAAKAPPHGVRLSRGTPIAA